MTSPTTIPAPHQPEVRFYLGRIAGMGEKEPGWSFAGVDPSADVISMAHWRWIARKA